jgi:hypothetical protein
MPNKAKATPGDAVRTSMVRFEKVDLNLNSPVIPFTRSL